MKSKKNQNSNNQPNNKKDLKKGSSRPQKLGRFARLKSWIKNKYKGNPNLTVDEFKEVDKKRTLQQNILSDKAYSRQTQRLKKVFILISLIMFAGLGSATYFVGKNYVNKSFDTDFNVFYQQSSTMYISIAPRSSNEIDAITEQEVVSDVQEDVNDLMTNNKKNPIYKKYSSTVVNVSWSGMGTVAVKGPSPLISAFKDDKQFLSPKKVSFTNEKGNAVVITKDEAKKAGLNPDDYSYLFDDANNCKLDDLVFNMSYTAASSDDFLKTNDDNNPYLYVFTFSISTLSGDQYKDRANRFAFIVRVLWKQLDDNQKNHTTDNVFEHDFLFAWFGFNPGQISGAITQGKKLSGDQSFNAFNLLFGNNWNHEWENWRAPFGNFYLKNDFNAGGPNGHADGKNHLSDDNTKDRSQEQNPGIKHPSDNGYGLESDHTTLTNDKNKIAWSFDVGYKNSDGSYTGSPWIYTIDDQAPYNEKIDDKDGATGAFDDANGEDKFQPQVIDFNDSASYSGVYDKKSKNPYVNDSFFGSDDQKDKNMLLYNHWCYTWKSSDDANNISNQYKDVFNHFQSNILYVVQNSGIFGSLTTLIVISSVSLLIICLIIFLVFFAFKKFKKILLWLFFLGIWTTILFLALMAIVIGPATWMYITICVGLFFFFIVFDVARTKRLLEMKEYFNRRARIRSHNRILIEDLIAFFMILTVFYVFMTFFATALQGIAMILIVIMLVLIIVVSFLFWFYIRVKINDNNSAKLFLQKMNPKSPQFHKKFDIAKRF